MPTYDTTFDVDATPPHVWEILTDLARYAEWNPQILDTSGSTEPGGEITLVLALSDGPHMTVTAVIEDSEPGRSLTWRGNGPRPWMFQGYRRFDIEATGNRSQVRHLEKITGLAAPLFSLRMGRQARRSHDALDTALQHRAANCV